MKGFELEEFLNSHENWEELLTQSPYNLTIKRKDNYILFKYNLFTSDLTNPIVKEARGSIFEENKQTASFSVLLPKNKWYSCVCMPFYIFRNYQEEIADDIDWDSAVITEKVDGSLIKFWYDFWGQEWHISTNGMIDARDAYIDGSELSFYDVAIEAFGNEEEYKYFLSTLPHDKTHMFELVSPKIKHVCKYPQTALYYLGSRNIVDATRKECDQTNNGSMDFTYHFLWLPQRWRIYIPKKYSFKTLKEAEHGLENLSNNDEGFVVCDKNYNRIKMKSETFLMLQAQKNSGETLNLKSYIKALFNNTLDDYTCYVDQEGKKKIEYYSYLWNNLIIYLDTYARTSLFKSPAQIATVNEIPQYVKNWLFYYYKNNKKYNAIHYLFNHITQSYALKLLQEHEKQFNLKEKYHESN